MKKQNIALKISLLALGLFFVLSVQTFAEVIKSFDAKISVNTDASVSVVETIIYDSEGLEKHGIFRDIRTTSSDGEEMVIKDISVTNMDGTGIQWQRQQNNGDVRLKIGDPDATFAGVKTYIISYTATNAVTHLENNLDEIYWNATGNDWPFSIEKVSALVIPPPGATISQESCYVGLKGSNQPCELSSNGSFETKQLLGYDEGMTVAVGFPSGFVFEHVPTTKEKILAFIGKFWPILLPLTSFIFMFQRWHRRGRDPKSKGIIIPQYDVPDDLTPLEVGGIVSEKIKNRNISAEIIYLATKGYLKIAQLNEKFLKIINNRDHELTLLAEPSSLSSDFDKKIITAIFGKKVVLGGTKKVSDLKDKFYANIPVIKKSVTKSLLSKKYYSNLPSKLYGLPTLGIFIIIISLYVYNSTGRFDNFFIMAGSIIVAIIIWAIFQKLMPARSIKGVDTRDYLLGLKTYLQIAEKDRLNFHNAPDKNPELFEKLLPYAMVFGVEELWAKEFEGIYTVPPAWYVGPADTFNVLYFGRDMAFFNSVTTSSLSSSPSSSGGSGGGGFSGGGGGGGGGGSW